MSLQREEADQMKEDGQSPKSLTDLFQHHFRTVDRLADMYGREGIRNLAENISGMFIISLFSGIGGAELLMHHIWLATTRKCEQMGISPLPEQPMPLLACDVDSDCQQVLLNHLYPPRYLVNNLLQFLKPSCVTTCKELCAKAAADREKLVAKIDAIKKKESKAKSKGKDKGTTEKQRKSESKPSTAENLELFFRQIIQTFLKLLCWRTMIMPVSDLFL